MNRRSIKINTLIVLLGIVDVALQFGSYYFLNQWYPACLIAIFVNLLLCHFYLETSLAHFSCFLHAAVTCLLSTVFIVFIYYYQNGGLLVYDGRLSLVLLLNWLIPFVYVVIRNFMDRGPRFIGFCSTFFKMSLLFAVYYIIVFALHYFFSPAAFPSFISAAGNPLIPFLYTASYIEDSIYLNLDIVPLLLYILKAFLLFLPLGFYASVLLKEASKIFLFLLAVLLPALSELIPYYLSGTFLIDNCLYNLIGFLAGICIFQLLNLISNQTVGTDFLAERSRYSFFNYYY